MTKRLLHYLALAGGICLGIVLLVATMGRACWHLSGVVHSGLPDARAPAASELHPTRARGTHSVGEWPAERGRNFREAPMLHARVVAGELPPVALRLPENPLVIHPPERIGPYGGTWKRLATSAVDVGIVFWRVSCERLVQWGPMGRKILPNLASSWQVDDESRTFTFRLRRGVRWSDGHPFTADDIIFWYRDVLLNPHLTPVIHPQFRRGGQVVRVRKLDDYAVQFSFKEPHVLFLQMMASSRAGGEYNPAIYPAHYLKQFHPKYVPAEVLDAKVKAAGFSFWYQLFRDRRGTRNVDLPRLSAWVVARPPPAQPAILERNPYYWKVDTRGNQLPYIDRIAVQILAPETLTLRAISGDIGMQGRHLDFSNYPLFMENRRRGGYRVLRWINSKGTRYILAPNLNHKDPVLRRIMADRRFRIALSVAINREELNEVVFFGIGTPRQAAPPPFSPFYSPEYAEAFTKYDPEMANRLLDEMGLDRRNGAGVRLRPDGKPLVLRIEMSTAFAANAKLYQLVADHWSAVGVKTELKLLARQLWNQRHYALIHDVAAFEGASDLNPLLDPRWLFPAGEDSYQGISYAYWFKSGGRAGEKPPREIRECMEIFRRIESTPDENERMRLFRRLIELNRRNLWIIGTVGDVPAIYVVKNTFRNVPEVAVDGSNLRSPSNTAPECYAIVPE